MFPFLPMSTTPSYVISSHPIHLISYFPNLNQSHSPIHHISSFPIPSPLFPPHLITSHLPSRFITSHHPTAFHAAAQLRALEERAAELESKHDIGMIEAQIIDKVGKAERDPTGVVKLPATAADGTSSEIGSVTFRVQAGGNNPLDTLD